MVMVPLMPCCVISTLPVKVISLTLSKASFPPWASSILFKILFTDWPRQGDVLVIIRRRQRIDTEEARFLTIFSSSRLSPFMHERAMPPLVGRVIGRKDPHVFRNCLALPLHKFEQARSTTRMEHFRIKIEKPEFLFFFKKGIFQASVEAHFFNSDFL
jgi:hypothetical protein